MSLDATKNFGKVEVSTGYDASATSIVLSASEGAKLPAPATDGAFNLVWYNATDYNDPTDDPNREIVRVTARSTDTLTVTRAQEDTSASTKNTVGKTYKMILAVTKKMIDDINTHITSSAHDDHTQYALLAGRSGGQTLIGGTASGNTLTLQSTSNATKGKILFGTSAYDEVNNRIGIGTASPSQMFHLKAPTGTDGVMLFESDSGNRSSFALKTGSAGQEWRFQKSATDTFVIQDTTAAQNPVVLDTGFTSSFVLHIKPSEVVINDSQADIDFRVESDTSPNVFHVDAGSNSVGIRKVGSATSPLSISGLPTSSAGLATGDVWSNGGVLTIV